MLRSPCKKLDFLWAFGSPKNSFFSPFTYPTENQWRNNSDDFILYIKKHCCKLGNQLPSKTWSMFCINFSAETQPVFVHNTVHFTSCLSRHSAQIKCFWPTKRHFCIVEILSSYYALLMTLWILAYYFSWHFTFCAILHRSAMSVIYFAKNMEKG